MRQLRVGLAQINTTVGDLEGNVKKSLDYIDQARKQAVDLVIFPELTITGYPPEDLLLRRYFVADNLTALGRLASGCDGITAAVGFVDRNNEGIYNAAAIIHDGKPIDVYYKQELPNHGVFDEKRYFQAGSACQVYIVCGTKICISVCEDIWHTGDPIRDQVQASAEVVVCLNASPYHIGKQREREEMLRGRARDYSVFICYANQVGGQDELVFDGGSMILSPEGKLISRAALFQEELLVHDLKLPDTDPTMDGVIATQISAQPLLVEKPTLDTPLVEPTPDEIAEIYSALVAGTGDYVHKTGFQKAVIALSGGIDSSLTACVAVDALEPENVVGVAMPSRYSSEGSLENARLLAQALSIEFVVIPIEPAHATLLKMIDNPKNEGSENTVEENLQARIRNNLIMALSNRSEWLVLTTGNKSEVAVGYSTLYGDMSGGFAVIKDVAKTLVYKLCRYRNSRDDLPVIPEAVFGTPPSAELKPGQLDQDTLPPYEILDPILEAYIENHKSSDEIAAIGYDQATVRKVISMVDRNEYKRRQAPPGIKITPRAFGRDRRLPIANHYRPAAR